MRRSWMVAVGLILLPACGGSGSGQASGCSAPHHDAFDPRSVTHVLPGASVPPYLTNPPTSGEHQPVDIRQYRGLLATPVLPQIQVALLESSQVLVQYRPPATVEPLRALTSDRLVTVAPSATLPTAVVATAWTWRLECRGEGAAAIHAVDTFIAAHAGKGPQPPPA